MPEHATVAADHRAAAYESGAVALERQQQGSLVGDRGVGGHQGPPARRER